MTKSAIVCMAYGTDPAGLGPSPMMTAVVNKALGLSYDCCIHNFILQGGYSANGGPTESKIMEGLVGQTTGDVLLDEESMNTIEGASAIASLATAHEINHLIVVAQSCHAWRVRYTFKKVLAKTGINFSVVKVRTPFGGNSQDRLNAWWRWWPWEIIARVYTVLLVH